MSSKFETKLREAHVLENYIALEAAQAAVYETAARECGRQLTTRDRSQVFRFGDVPADVLSSQTYGRMLRKIQGRKQVGGGLDADYFDKALLEDHEVKEASSSVGKALGVSGASVLALAGAGFGGVQWWIRRKDELRREERAEAKEEKQGLLATCQKSLEAKEAELRALKALTPNTDKELGLTKGILTELARQLNILAFVVPGQPVDATIQGKFLEKLENLKTDLSDCKTDQRDFNERVRLVLEKYPLSLTTTTDVSTTLGRAHFFNQLVAKMENDAHLIKEKGQTADGALRDAQDTARALGQEKAAAVAEKEALEQTVATLEGEKKTKEERILELGGEVARWSEAKQASDAAKAAAIAEKAGVSSLLSTAQGTLREISAFTKDKWGVGVASEDAMKAVDRSWNAQHKVFYDLQERLRSVYNQPPPFGKDIAATPTDMKTDKYTELVARTVTLLDQQKRQLEQKTPSSGETVLRVEHLAELEKLQTQLDAQKVLAQQATQAYKRVYDFINQDRTYNAYLRDNRYTKAANGDDWIATFQQYFSVIVREWFDKVDMVEQTEEQLGACNKEIQNLQDQLTQGFQQALPTEPSANVQAQLQALGMQNQRMQQLLNEAALRVAQATANATREANQGHQQEIERFMQAQQHNQDDITRLNQELAQAQAQSQQLSQQVNTLSAAGGNQVLALQGQLRECARQLGVAQAELGPLQKAAQFQPLQAPIEVDQSHWNVLHLPSLQKMFLLLMLNDQQLVQYRDVGRADLDVLRNFMTRDDIKEAEKGTPEDKKRVMERAYLDSYLETVHANTPLALVNANKRQLEGLKSPEEILTALQTTLNSPQEFVPGQSRPKLQSLLDTLAQQARSTRTALEAKDEIAAKEMGVEMTSTSRTMWDILTRIALERFPDDRTKTLANLLSKVCVEAGAEVMDVEDAYVNARFPFPEAKKDMDEVGKSKSYNETKAILWVINDIQQNGRFSAPTRELLRDYLATAYE